MRCLVFWPSSNKEFRQSGAYKPWCRWSYLSYKEATLKYIYIYLYNYLIRNRSKNYNLFSLHLTPNGKFTRLHKKCKMVIISVFRPLAVYTVMCNSSRAPALKVISTSTFWTLVIIVGISIRDFYCISGPHILWIHSVINFGNTFFLVTRRRR